MRNISFKTRDFSERVTCYCSLVQPKITPVLIFVKNTNSLRCDNPIGEPFFELSEVDSTNNYAMGMAQAHLAVHGTTWFAHYQNAGKGQRGKAWSAEPGKNIILSVLLDTQSLIIENQVLLNAAVTLACFDLLSGYAKENTSIKWPNDIYWDDRKAGGILIENVLKGGKWRYAIVGIGLNINQTLFPGTIHNPVSLSQITGQSFNVVALAKDLCRYLENRWRQLLAPAKNSLLDEYNSRLYKVNKIATFQAGNTVFKAIVKGVNAKGELILRREEDQQTVTYSAVEWLIP